MEIIKLKRLHFLSVITILTFGVMCVSCEKNGIDATEVQIIKEFEEGKTFFVGTSLRFEAIVLPKNTHNTAVKWSSSNPAVATISKDGEMLAVGAGTTIITCMTEDEKLSDFITITVVENYAANIKGTYKGTVIRNETETLAGVSIVISPISSILSENISISLTHESLSIRSNAAISFNGRYDIQGDGFLNTSTSLTLEGNINSEATTANLVFTHKSDTSKTIAFNGIKN